MKSNLVGAIDQGTSSSRFIIFDISLKKVVASHQEKISQFCPKSGWVEICPKQIYDSVMKCIEEACKKLSRTNYSVSQIRSVGLANQRETTIVWDSSCGEPLFNAIVWLDCRTAQLADEFIEKTPDKSKDFLKSKTGLPIHSYFSALKIRWLLDNVNEVQNSLQRGTLMFGTVDSWLLWKLTGKHITDVTNASRTLLMDLNKLDWSLELCKFFKIPRSILPKICSSAEFYSNILHGPLKGIPFTGCLGDQQAAMLGQNCIQYTDIKSTYGTGTFVLCNTGTNLIISKNGLLSSIGYQLGKNTSVTYVLEGSGSIGGNSVRFLRDNLAIINNLSEVENLANSVKDSGGVIFVPSFSGLFAPYWDSTARGTMFGLDQSTRKGHIVRAVLQAICCQTAELIDAFENDLGAKCVLGKLKIDGKVTSNVLFNQMLSDTIGRSIFCCPLAEATSWGAALASAIGANIISVDELNSFSFDKNAIKYDAKGNNEERMKLMFAWKEAIKRTQNWIS